MVCRIVLADDHRLLREGLRMLLHAPAELELVVVAEASDIAETLRVTRRHEPDVLVLDLSMPGGSSLDLIATLLAERPILRILVLTMHDDPAFVRSTFAAGAHGYLLKHCAYLDLVAALRTVIGGQTYVDPSLVQRQLDP